MSVEETVGCENNIHIYCVYFNCLCGCLSSACCLCIGWLMRALVNHLVYMIDVPVL